MSSTAPVLDPSAAESPPPPLKWAGGKRWLVPHLRTLFAGVGERRLVEPFAGGLAVALGLHPRRALLADINPHLINFYRWLQHGLELTIPLRNARASYYRRREEFNRLITTGSAETAEGAALFYYLNRTGYNGLCRFNSRGLFNVPFGRYTTINYTRDFSPWRRALREWRFICGDFEAMPRRAGDFLYADPPYDVPFRRYAGNDFTWEDQLRLAHWLRAHRGPVVASNQATPRVLELYRGLGFTVRTVPAPRMISCTGDRAPALEMIATLGL